MGCSGGSAGTTGSTTECDPGDWSLVAANSTGNTLLTQFDEPGNTALSLLMATSRSLFVGFNNGTKGAVVLRSSGATPVPTASAAAERSNATPRNALR